LAFLVPYLIITALAFYLLITSNKIAVINTNKKVNLRCPDKFWLKTLVKKNIILFIKNRTILAAIAFIKKKSNSFEKPIFKILLPNLPAIIIIRISLL